MNHHTRRNLHTFRQGARLPRIRISSALVGALLSCVLIGCAAQETAQTTDSSSATTEPGKSASEAGQSGSEGSSTGASGPEASPSDSPTAPLAGLTIAIDPGHNGANSSNQEAMNASVPDGRGGTKACNTVGTESDDGYPEHQFTWEAAQAVRDALPDAGAAVVFSRASDDGAGPCVDERGTFADDSDALVSLHGNGSEDRTAHGFHVIACPAGGRGDEDTERTSEALGLAMVDALEDAGLTRNPAYNELVVRSDLATLNNAAVPAVMLEAGEMRNADDARMLGSQDGQDRIAEALVTSLTAVLVNDAP